MARLGCVALCLVSLIPFLQAFVPTNQASRVGGVLSASRGDVKNDSFLLEEFKTHNGEVIDPYKVLKISRKAERLEIKQSYRDLSRRYHPDGFRHRRHNDILPGSCNSHEEVRDHWERIKLAYEILSDPKRRSRYDRHEALADPGAAIQRAAIDAAFSGVKGVGEGLFSVGTFAFQQMTGVKNKNNEKERMREAEERAM